MGMEGGESTGVLVSVPCSCHGQPVKDSQTGLGLMGWLEMISHSCEAAGWQEGGTALEGPTGAQ